MVQIYSTNSHKLLAEFGKRGRGPKEFIRPLLIKQTSYDPTNNPKSRARRYLPLRFEKRIKSNKRAMDKPLLK